MLIGLAGDPLKKNPGLLKQDSTRTAQDSQREPSVHRGLLVLSGTGLKKEQFLRSGPSDPSQARAGSVKASSISERMPWAALRGSGSRVIGRPTTR